jgi:HEAT repeat protein
LASSGDPQWFPLLLADAQKQPGGNLYPAAENGGDRAVPFLVDLIHSDTELRLEAIGAMGHTGSRAAVPILLDLLRSADAKTAECAMYALQALTRRAFKGAVDSPQSQYPIWQAWWSREGATARIYKPTDCSETVPLQ